VAAAAVGCYAQLEFKDAYNRFKRDTTIIFLIFPRTNCCNTHSQST
jgi:hypothetical protein